MRVDESRSPTRSLGPVPVNTSPEWSGSETGGRRYSPFTINTERLKPWHTLTGRQHFYLDHDWMSELGEQLPIFRPPLDMTALFNEPAVGDTSGGITVRYLTPHSKWSIHSAYQDNLHMLTLSRGGQAIWMSDVDAAKIGVKDNDWIECTNRNGVVNARAIVSHRMPEGPGVHVSRAGQGRGRATYREDRQARRHPQCADPDHDQAVTPDRRLRSAVLRTELPRPHRKPARRGHHDQAALARSGVLTMKVMAQLAMVMNLDKCIGCHTCSVTCKQAWTNRGGMEYVWFNNVETRPGQGYPRRYQDQEKWKGGWTLNKRGKLTLKSGSRVKRLLNIFANPDLPAVSDYYEPWTYDYETLLSAPAMDTTPVARPKSLITGQDTKVTWGANWDDDLGGGARADRPRSTAGQGVRKVKLEFEQTFMFYLPRICEHCLNPSCAASCPSGAIYKRSEDGIVLVDQDRCRGWRQCVTAAPTRRSTSTTRPAKPRSARSATRASKSASRRSARRRVSAGCATSAWCSMTPTRCAAASVKTRRISIRRSWACS